MSQRKPVQTEQTPKSWKLLQLIGGLGLLLFLGVLLTQLQSDVGRNIGIAGVIGSIALYSIGRVGGWWVAG